MDARAGNFKALDPARKGLNNDLPRYRGNPIGNSPELMIMDCSLNKDLDDELWRHILYTRFLPEEDVRKFSLSTPLRGEHAIKRLWKYSLSSLRIIQDTYKKLDSLKAIYDVKGVMVENLGNRNGRRALESQVEGLNKRGGARVRRVVNTQRWIHEDARVPRLEMLARSKQIYSGDIATLDVEGDLLPNEDDDSV